MPSTIPGFEYDIFISYRQKDNEYDGWVTEFVGNLRKELRATFKEDISIYIDENPHDGLLETHHVDKSLVGKLKCLIFIPIISQTYCDPKSFAWHQEFCAFNKLSKEDQFGREIRLGNGNVASRILPVRIHSLDASDHKLLEAEIGSALRAIEFIYKEPGVNRPLGPDDDTSENLNKTKYRNQVNKVANAVKAIIEGLKNFGNPDFYVASDEEVAEKVKVARGKSIVVLPFEDMSPEKDQEYFCDGLAEELINALTKIKDIHVVARTSAFSFKGKETDVKKIGKKLKVESLLEGSVRKAGNKLRITVQLINVTDGFHLWSERYDRELSDVFAIQDEIALNIVDKLRINLLGEEKKLILKRHTEDVEASNLYAKGRYFQNKITEEGFRKGIEYFDQAIKKDPDYALAYGGMADCYAFLGWYYYLSSKEAFPKAKAAAQKALVIDENLSAAHASLGWVKMIYDRDWTGAEKEFVRAIELDARDANTRLFYSMYLAATGRHDESIAEAKRAQRLDPVTPITTMNLAMRFYYAQQFDPAIEQIKSLLEMDPNFSMAYYYLAWPYAQKGMLNEALENVTKAMESLGKPTPVLLCLGIVYALLRKKDEANNVLDELFALSKKKFISPYRVAEIHAGLNQKKQAFDWLEKAYEEHDPVMIYLNVDPLLDSLRPDPRFTTLLKKMGLSRGELDHQPFSNEVTTPQEKSIVVLPFENNSPDKADEYFSDGLTEEIITDLSKIHSLRVISRSSAMRLKGTSKDVKTIGRELNVRYVLEGSVRKAKDNLRITAELVDTATDTQLWAEKYNGTMADVFDIQEKVSRSIAQALKLKLSPEEYEHIKERPIHSVHAYECYLRARQEIWSFTADGRLRAIQLLRNGLALAGDNALLYATLGYAHVQAYHMGTRADEALLEEANTCARRAIDLEPESAYGYGVSGVAHCYRGEGQLAVRELKRALKFDPNNADVLFHLSWYYADAGFIDLATPLAARLATIDPLTPISQAMPGWIAMHDGRLAEGLPPYEKMYVMDPRSPFTRWAYAMMLGQNDRTQQACELFDEVIADAPGTPMAWYSRMLASALRGNRGDTLAAVTPELIGWARPQFQFSWFVAQAFARVGESDLSLDWLWNAFRLGFLNYRFLAEHDVHLRSLHGDERFGQLIVEMQRQWEAFEP